MHHCHHRTPSHNSSYSYCCQPSMNSSSQKTQQVGHSLSHSMRARARTVFGEMTCLAETDRKESDRCCGLWTRRRVKDRSAHLGRRTEAMLLSRRAEATAAGGVGRRSHRRRAATLLPSPTPRPVIDRRAQSASQPTRSAAPSARFAADGRA
jgi:hypothetical protein